MSARKKTPRKKPTAEVRALLREQRERLEKHHALVLRREVSLAVEAAERREHSRMLRRLSAPTSELGLYCLRVPVLLQITLEVVMGDAAGVSIFTQLGNDQKMHAISWYPQRGLIWLQPTWRDTLSAADVDRIVAGAVEVYHRHMPRGDSDPDVQPLTKTLTGELSIEAQRC